MKALTFGLVGCGQHGRNVIVPAMQQCDVVKLVAVADCGPDNLAAVVGPSLRRFASVQAMLEQETLDAVYVATPVRQHADVVLAALEAGCHVITEKPMGYTVADCRAMVAAATTAGKTLAVDFESRLIPHYRRIRQWVDGGLLGKVRAVHIDHFWDGHKPSTALGPRREKFLNDSGCLDCGIHAIDLVRYLSGGGAWQKIQAMGAWFGEKVRFPPHLSILATLDNGVMATVNASFAFTAYIPQRTRNANYRNLAIVGERGVVAYHHDLEGTAAFELVSEALCAVEPARYDGHRADIAALLERFAAAICRGEPLPPEVAGGYDGLMAQICMDEANRQTVLQGDSAHTATGGRDGAQA